MTIKMINTYKYISSIILLASVTVGCQKNPVVESPSYDITFSIQSSEATKAAGQYSGSDLSQLDSFKVSGFDGIIHKLIDNQYAYKSATPNLWQLNGNPKVWEKGLAMTFWADANMPSWASVTHTDSTKAVFSVTSIPSSANDQCDPLIGNYRGLGNQGNAPIKFFHPMTAVKFITGEKGQPAYVQSIKSVTLINVHSSGSANVSRVSNDSLSYAWTTNAKTTVSGVFSGDQSAKPFLLIPQNLSTANVTMTVEIDRVVGTDTTLTVDLPAADNWKAGYCYTYTLDYLPLHPMEGTLKVTLTDWVYVSSTSGKHFFDADFDD